MIAILSDGMDRAVPCYRIEPKVEKHASAGNRHMLPTRLAQAPRGSGFSGGLCLSDCLEGRIEYEPPSTDIDGANAAVLDHCPNEGVPHAQQIARGLHRDRDRLEAGVFGCAH
jgi:hypothetical protein